MLSAAATAVAAGLLACWVRRETQSLLAASVAALSFSSASAVWALAGVAEMYSINALFAALLLLVISHGVDQGGWDSPAGRRWYAVAALVFGVGLGNHQTLMLVAPAFVALAWPVGWDKRLIRAAVGLLALGALGLSVVLGIPFRAMSRPFINWGDAVTVERFLYVLQRENIGKGKLHQTKSAEELTVEEAVSQTAIWGRSLVRELGPVGLALATLGIVGGWRPHPRRMMFLLLFSLGSGLLFRWLARMPDDPISRAILQPHDVLPLLGLAGAVGMGVAQVERYLLQRGPAVTWIGRAIVSVSLVLVGMAHADRSWRRHDFHAPDLASNLLRGFPRDAVVVTRGDIPLFLLMYDQLAERRRLDVRLVPHNLYPWRITQLGDRWPDLLPPPNGPEDAGAPYRARLLVAAARRWPVILMGDLPLDDPLLSGFSSTPEGLGGRLLPPQVRSVDGPDEKWERLKAVLILRGTYARPQRLAYFDQEIVDNLAAVAYAHAVACLKSGTPGRAADAATLAVSMRGDIPEIRALRARALLQAHLGGP